MLTFFFIPFILAQKLFFFLALLFLDLGFGAGGRKLPPVALLYERLPFALSPPDLAFPALRCQAGFSFRFVLQALGFLV